MEEKKIKIKNNDKMEELLLKIDKIIESQMIIMELLTNNNKKKYTKEKTIIPKEDIESEKKISEDEKEEINNSKEISEDLFNKKKISKKYIEEELMVEKKPKKIINNLPNIIIKNYEYKEVKKEYFNIDEKFVKDCLNMNNLTGDIKLFKKMYIENIPKEFYPIRHIQKNLQYWLNNKMNDDDINGTYIKNIILNNIENCYLKVNIFENYSENMEQFLKNQEHINRISENKYKDNFLNKIITLISI